MKGRKVSRKVLPPNYQGLECKFLLLSAGDFIHSICDRMYKFNPVTGSKETGVHHIILKPRFCCHTISLVYVAV